MISSLMGFPCICHIVILPSPLALLFYLLHRITSAIAILLSYLGIFDHVIPSEILPSPWSQQSPRTTTTAPMITPTVMKSKLPVMEYGRFLDRHCKKKITCCPEEPSTCVVCLGWLEAKDEIRKLGNCTHAFHKGCMDGWLDLGHLNCPLCRSPLLPLQANVRERLWSNITNLPRFWW